MIIGRRSLTKEEKKGRERKKQENPPPPGEYRLDVITLILFDDIFIYLVLLFASGTASYAVSLVGRW